MSSRCLGERGIFHSVLIDFLTLDLDDNISISLSRATFHFAFIFPYEMTYIDSNNPTFKPRINLSKITLSLIFVAAAARPRVIHTLRKNSPTTKYPHAKKKRMP